jgi:hypothetical protein
MAAISCACKCSPPCRGILAVADCRLNLLALPEPNVNPTNSRIASLCCRHQLHLLWRHSCSPQRPPLCDCRLGSHAMLQWSAQTVVTPPPAAAVLMLPSAAPAVAALFVTSASSLSSLTPGFPRDATVEYHDSRIAALCCRHQLCLLLRHSCSPRRPHCRH